MRKAFGQAGSQSLLCDMLQQVGPVGLSTYLDDGPGFRVQLVGQEDQEARRD